MKKVLITILMISGSFASDNSDRVNNQSLGTTNLRIETSIGTKNAIIQDGIKNQKRKSTKAPHDRVIKKSTGRRIKLRKELNNLKVPEAQRSSYLQAVKNFFSSVATLISNARDSLYSWY